MITWRRNGLGRSFSRGVGRLAVFILIIRVSKFVFRFMLRWRRRVAFLRELLALTRRRFGRNVFYRWLRV